MMEIDKLKFYGIVEKNFASTGFKRENVPFHTEQCLHAFQGFLAITMQSLYLFFVANTAKDYMDSIFMTAGG